MIKKQIDKILEIDMRNENGTIDIMDRFEGHGLETAYKQMVLRNVACINVDGKYIQLSLVVERSKDHRYIGNITFTELRQGNTKNLNEYLRNQITTEVIRETKDSNEMFMFSTPYLFRAQNSTNRSGYGWGYGGTQYGETTAYVFVGAYIGYRSRGFTEAINEKLAEADLSEFTIKNYTGNTVRKVFDMNAKTKVDEHFEVNAIGQNEEQDDLIELFEDDADDVSDVCFSVEKRSIPGEELKPDWYYAGFEFEINLFILSLKERIYLPQVVDECENEMILDENTRDSVENSITIMEKAFMFSEMIANSIGYSSQSVMLLDAIQKRKILMNILLNEVDNVVIGEYGSNSISYQIYSIFLYNQPELVYRGYAEMVLTCIKKDDGGNKYELLGTFSDFGDNKVPLDERQFWSGRDRYLLDVGENGSYLEGIYRKIMNG